MGQRLNIEINKNGELLANAYYHWSGYTKTALALTSMIVAKSKEIENTNDVLYAIELLEATGARLTDKEIKYAKSIGINKKFEPAVSRNDGLIAISEKGMIETRFWEEACVEIDIENKTVVLDVFASYSKEDYLEYYSKEDYEKLSIWKHSLNPFDTVTFDDVVPLYNYVLSEMDAEHYDLKLEEGEEPSVISFI